MVIKRSSSAEVTRLLEALLAADPVGREAAAARLAILGPRAVERLVGSLPGLVDPGHLLAVLDVLERIGDARGAAAAAPWIADERPEVALAAVAVVRRTLSDEAPDAAALAAEALVAVAMDASRPAMVRDVALDALRDLPGEVVEPLLTRLPASPPVETQAERRAGARTGTTPTADDGSVPPGQAPSTVDRGAPAAPRVEGRVGPGVNSAAGADAVRVPKADWLASWIEDEGAAGSPDPVRRAIAASAARAPLSLLHRLVTKLRAVESHAPAGDTDLWRAVRGSVHQALAERGSRVALYDLRETVEQTHGTLPVSMLAALSAVGDATCLDAVAAAWAGTSDAWLKGQLRDAFAAIVAREKLTRRHASVRRVATHQPELLDAVSTPSRTTPSRSRSRRT